MTEWSAETRAAIEEVRPGARVVSDLYPELSAGRLIVLLDRRAAGPPG